MYKNTIDSLAHVIFFFVSLITNNATAIIIIRQIPLNTTPWRRVEMITKRNTKKKNKYLHIFIMSFLISFHPRFKRIENWFTIPSMAFYIYNRNCSTPPPQDLSKLYHSNIFVFSLEKFPRTKIWKPIDFFLFCSELSSSTFDGPLLLRLRLYWVCVCHK